MTAEKVIQGGRLRVFLAILFLHQVAFTFAQKDMSLIRRVTKEDGLSSSEISSVVQDQQGFLWIGTNSGLNRYDGQSVKVYRHSVDDTTSLTDNRITCLFVNKRGELWIGTATGGLSIYDFRTDRFESFKWSIHPNSLSFNYVTSIEEDSHGTMWVSTQMGLNRYQRPHKDFKRFLCTLSIMPKPNQLDSLKKNHCPQYFLNRYAAFLNDTVSNEVFFKNIALSTSNLYWIRKIARFSTVNLQGTDIKTIEAGTENLWIAKAGAGLASLDLRTETLHSVENELSGKQILNLLIDNESLWVTTIDEGIKRFSLKDSSVKDFPETSARKFIKSIFKDHHHNVWAGNEEGLLSLNKQYDKFESVGLDDKVNSGLLMADVSVIFEDVFKNLWVASNHGGLNLLKQETDFKRLLVYKDGDQKRPAAVSAVLQDVDNNVWVGYFTAGIDVFSPEGKLMKSFLPGAKAGLGRGTVHALFQDSHGNIWTGTYEGGLQRYDNSQKRFLSYDFSQPGKSIMDVRSIDEDTSGNIWIAVHGDGIKKYNPITKTFSHYRTNYGDLKHSLSSDWTFAVHCDAEGRVWVGSVMGVNIMDQKNSFQSFNRFNSQVSHNMVKVFAEDKKGQMWIGTEEGLNCLQHGNSFKIYTEKNGLPSDDIRGIMEDHRGFLWISTSNGLAKFDSETGTVKVYLTNKDFRSNEFLPGAYAKGSAGNFFFGGKNGVDSFDPEAVSDYPFKLPVVITDFKIFNESVPISQRDDAILTTAPGNANSIILPYDRNVFSFAFTAINFVMPERNMYAYYMEGFDKKWNVVGNKSEATYTNLDPGTYTFHVKAANHDGVWNDKPTSIKLRITPPWWLRIETKILYLIAIFTIAYFIRRAIVARIRLKHLIELDEMKLRFFANISHELRTPLTLLLAPLTDLSLVNKLWKKDQRDMVTMMNTNGQRMIRLINQLMDIHKIDAGVVRLRVSDGNLSAFVSNVFNTFCYQAEKNNIDYSMHPTDDDNIMGFFDAEKVEQVLVNLISNAFKYSVHGTSITLNMSVCTSSSREVPVLIRKRNNSSKRIAKISLSDRGTGIAPENHEKIFDRFFRTDDVQNAGTGIGLSLARQLSRIHRGDITVWSQPGYGSVFTLWLPIDSSSYTASEIDLKSQRPLQFCDIDRCEEIEMESTHGYMESDGLPILLIIDDNEDIRRYIQYCFKGEFNVIAAEDGETGVEKTMEIIPDFVICDVMLPGICGFEVCSTIKKEERTSHIPVILLTAKASESAHLKGIKECSANDYITKPFNTDLLKAKIRNIHAYRKKLKVMLQLELQQQSNDVSFSIDDLFLRKIIEIVENNMDNPDFDVLLLAREIAMSQTNLYRKLQGVVGLSANQFIRKIRLKRAEHLLTNGHTVVEVAFMVGFKDPKYFSKVFKKEFSVLPHEFMRSIQVAR